MKHIAMILGVLLTAGAACQSASAEPSPMVQRHIFAPDQGVEQKENPAASNPIDSAGLEKELTFTGVLLTSKGKQVILSETGRNDMGMKKQKHVLQEGESIKGMTIKEIGSNYLILSSNENLVRLKLYAGVKSRPAPPPEPAPPEAAGPAGNPMGLVKPPMPGKHPQNPGMTNPGVKTDRKSQNAPGATAPPAVPFDNTGNGAFGGGGDNPGQQQSAPPTTTGTATTSNPFLDAIKRSAENAPPGGAGVPNPFTGN